MDTIQLLDPNDGLTITRSLLAVANSGDNSVSLFSLEQNPQSRLYRMDLLTTVRNIPQPDSVAACDPGLTAKVLVTSFLGHSLTVIEAPSGSVLGTVSFTFPPLAVECDLETFDERRAVVTLANDTLVVVDLNSLTTLANIPNVPGTALQHGIAIWNRTAWIPSQERGLVTLVDLRTFERVGEIPIAWPLGVVCCHYYDRHTPYMVVPSYTLGLAEFDVLTLSPRFTLPEVSYPIDAAISSLGLGVVPQADSILIIPYGEPAVTVSGLPGPTTIASWFRGDIVLQNDDQPVFVATSSEQDKVYLVQKAPNVPRAFEMTEATFNQTLYFDLAPGGLATAWASTGLNEPQQATGIPLPRALGGLQMSVGGAFTWVADHWEYSPEGSVEVPLLYADSSQINFQVPPEVRPSSLVPFEIKRPDGSRLQSWVSVAETSPGVFSVISPTLRRPAILNQDYSLNGWPALDPGTKAATRGSFIQIFASGAGATHPPLSAGEAAPLGGPLIRTTFQPTIEIGGQPADVQFSGMAPSLVGVWQINAKVPVDAVPYSHSCSSYGNAQEICVDYYQLSILLGGKQISVIDLAVE